MFLSGRKKYNALPRYTIAEWEKAFSGMDCGSGVVGSWTHPEIREMEISDVKFTQCHPHQQQKHPISRAMPDYIYIYMNLYWGCFIALDLPRRWTTMSYVFKESYVGQKKLGVHADLTMPFSWSYMAIPKNVS